MLTNYLPLFLTKEQKNIILKVLFNELFFKEIGERIVVAREGHNSKNKFGFILVWA